ncbi:MAG: M23 family metallopeptidase, partial [Pseudonocardiaceae bacterium]
TVAFPLPEGTWRATSPYGGRSDPVTGQHAVHTGSDFAAPLDTPILAYADGTVIYAGAHPSGYAHLILIEHMIDGRKVVSGYAHMYADGIHVQVGDRTTAGQHIGDVGADGKATGPHLHFEVRVNGQPTDPAPWLDGTPALPAAASGANSHQVCP